MVLLSIKSNALVLKKIFSTVGFFSKSPILSGHNSKIEIFGFNKNKTEFYKFYIESSIFDDYQCDKLFATKILCSWNLKKIFCSLKDSESIELKIYNNKLTVLDKCKNETHFVNLEIVDNPTTEDCEFEFKPKYKLANLEKCVDAKNPIWGPDCVLNVQYNSINFSKLRKLKENEKQPIWRHQCHKICDYETGQIIPNNSCDEIFICKLWYYPDNTHKVDITFNNTHIMTKVETDFMKVEIFSVKKYNDHEFFEDLKDLKDLEPFCYCSMGVEYLKNKFGFYKCYCGQCTSHEFKNTINNIENYKSLFCCCCTQATRRFLDKDSCCYCRYLNEKHLNINK